MKAKGANALVYFKDQAEEEATTRYIHFGECPTDDETNDDHVFYYVSDEVELCDMVDAGKDSPGDFVVLSYELVSAATPLVSSDYKLIEGSAWIEVKGFAIHITETDDGVAAKIYQNGEEWEPIAEAIALDAAITN